MNERYEILKNVYPNYLIFFKSKDKIKYIGETKEILDVFTYKNLKSVNQIIINNLDIEEIIEYENDNYDLYLAKAKMIKIIKYLKDKGWSKYIE